MNRSIQDIRALLGPLDPEREPAAAADQGRDRAAGRSHAMFSRRTMLVGSAAAAVAVGASVAQLSGATRQPVERLATPTPLEVNTVNSAPELGTVIERLAVTAEESATPAAELPASEYLQLSSWYLDTAVAGRSVTSQLRPWQSESWRRPDGSWTVTTSDSGPEVFPPGTRAVYWPDRPPVDDPAALDVWLNAIHPMSRGDKGLLTVGAITDLVRERVLLPVERAAVLRLLGTIPGVHYAGTTVDRAGRPGEALVLDIGRPALPARHTLVVDPATGRILAYEEMLTEDPGALNVPIPAVIQYETYLVAEFR